MSLFHVYTQWLEVILSGKARFTICADEESGFNRVRGSVYILIARICIVVVFADFRNGAIRSQLAVFGGCHYIPKMFLQGWLFVAYKAYMPGATFGLYIS